MSRGREWKQAAVPIGGILLLVVVALVFGNPERRTARPGRHALRLGYFPNVTHAPAILGVERGHFREALGERVNLETRLFNAGPEGMEALLAGGIDLAYVGPSPAINTYLKSEGRALRILAGACSGGAALVARAGSGIDSIGDLDGKRLAIPQLGGTQDVSARHFLARSGLQPTEKGGTVHLLPVKNPDILALLLKGELDAAWVPEPWASRLEHEAGARLVVDERDLWPGRRFPTTVLVARTAYLERRPAQAEGILTAHLRCVKWLRHNPDEARKATNAELRRLTGKELPRGVLADAWDRVEFTADPDISSIRSFAAAAEAAGYLPRQRLDIAGLFELQPLERARRRASDPLSRVAGRAHPAVRSHPAGGSPTQVGRVSLGR